MFTVTVRQDPEDAPNPEEVYQALGLLLLPRACALWEAWVRSGLLTVEEGKGGRRWQVNGAPDEADSEDGDGDK